MRIHNLEKDFFNRITRSKSLFVTKMTDRLGLQAPPQVVSISGQRLNEGTTSMGQILSKLSDIEKALDELDKSVVSSKAIAEENRLNIGIMNNKLSNVIKAICIVGGSACAVYLSILIARKIDSSHSPVVSKLIEDIELPRFGLSQPLWLVGYLRFWKVRASQQNFPIRFRVFTKQNVFEVSQKSHSTYLLVKEQIRN